ncbi:MAG: dihydrolipoyl dehydrogenase [Solirubrobacteraceae bacterium]|nr:dihydrolipoyl dehydrogenase [Solirubrobacteraceae bacterium]
MSTLTEVPVPDIGDFTDVPVVEVLVAVGDTVALEDPLVELESDKASFEVPSTATGTIKEIKVAIGDKVSEGTVLVVVEGDGDGGGDAPKNEPKAETPDGEPKTDATPGDEHAVSADAPAPDAAPAAAPADDFERSETHAQVLVLGSGPGGYSAAFRAADLGLDVIMVERYPSLGGVCLNVGCIPSKALLHVAKVMAEAAELTADGAVAFAEPEVDLDGLRAHKDGVVGKLTQGVGGMAARRKVRVLHGEGRFTSPHHLELTPTGDGVAPDLQTISFDHAIIAAGSKVVRIPGIPYEDPRVWDSTAALELREIPDRLLVVGGGIIGLEMATVYDAIGSKVTVVELSPDLIPGCDRDLVRPLQKRIEGRYAAIHTNVKVDHIEATDDGLVATFAAAEEGKPAPEPATFDAVLVAVGRAANGNDLGLDTTGVEVNERGQVPVDLQRRTNVPHLYAIGDLTPGPMLAHKASHEAHVAAEAIAGEAGAAFDVRGIPSVAYTDPEIAWVGLTETQAKADGTPYETAVFPWVASGRALSLGGSGSAGRTKLLVDPESRRVLGAGIVGPNAGELIAEPGFALEMGADVADLALTVHAHPTLSESVGLAAEVAEGTVTDLPPQRKRAKG